MGVEWKSTAARCWYHATTATWCWDRSTLGERRKCGGAVEYKSARSSQRSLDTTNLNLWTRRAVRNRKHRSKPLHTTNHTINNNYPSSIPKILKDYLPPLKPPQNLSPHPLPSTKPPRPRVHSLEILLPEPPPLHTHAPRPKIPHRLIFQRAPVPGDEQRRSARKRGARIQRIPHEPQIRALDAPEEAEVRGREGNKVGLG